MKFLALLVLAFELCAADARAQGLTLTAPPATVGIPATITVTLTGATNGPGVGLQFSLPPIAGATYSPAAGPAVTPGNRLSCGTVNGSYNCVIAGDVVPLVDGVVATLLFTPTRGGTTPLPLTGMLAVNAAGDSPGIPVASGPLLNFQVSASKCDLNGDGLVDATDLGLAIQAAVNKTISAALDVSGDGVVNIIDVQRVVVAVKTGVCR